MGELWRDLVETLRQRPWLWLPVLVADLLGYLVNLGRNGVLRQIVLHETAHHSALGGAVVHTPMTASAAQSTTILALLLSWLTNFLRVLLYSGALVGTVALMRAYLDREQKPLRAVGPALGRSWGGILELALRALMVYALAALVLSWLSPFLNRHGSGALLRNGWFSLGLTVGVLLVLATLLAPVAVRVLAGRAPDKDVTRLSQQFSFTLAIVVALLAAMVSANARELALVRAGARYPLEIVGSLLVALPYVLLFVGLGLLARKTRAAGAEDEAA